MQLDKLSELFVALILRIQEKTPGLVSEIWINPETLNQIKNTYTSSNNETIIKKFTESLASEPDLSRKEYLTGLLTSLVYQLGDENDKDLVNFYKNTYDFDLTCISEKEISEANAKLQKLERDNNLYRHDLFLKLNVKKENLLPEFKRYLDKYKALLPKYLETNGEFEYEVVSQAPWGAFNYHIAPFISKLTLNSSVGLTTLDLKHLAVHEAFGGHHTELSLKDRLLVNKQRGENGFVLVYSPQVFISEGLAEAAFEIFQYDKDLTIEEQVISAYQDLSIALTNKVVFMYYQDKLPKEEIEKYIDSFDMGDLGKSNIINFVYDQIFGEYPAVYYSAKKFMLETYERAKDKKGFLLEVYTQPVTPSLLARKYR